MRAFKLRLTNKRKKKRGIHRAAKFYRRHSHLNLLVDPAKGLSPRLDPRPKRKHSETLIGKELFLTCYQPPLRRGRFTKHLLCRWTATPGLLKISQKFKPFNFEETTKSWRYPFSRKLIRIPGRDSPCNAFYLKRLRGFCRAPF